LNLIQAASLLRAYWAFGFTRRLHTSLPVPVLLAADHTVTSRVTNSGVGGLEQPGASAASPMIRRPIVLPRRTKPAVVIAAGGPEKRSRTTATSSIVERPS